MAEVLQPKGIFPGEEPNMENSDAYFKKTIRYSYRGLDLQFRVSQELFSSHDIDIGTQRLLRTLTSEGFNTFNKVLDLGCGYGPIGIALSTVRQSSVVHMVDRDALALNYSRQNVELNNLSNAKVYASLGFDDVKETDFDLIVSNIPAKVGEPVISHILQDARYYLRSGGRVAVVVIDAIAEYVAGVLADPSINILFSKSWPGHVVYHFEFFPEASLEPKPMDAFDRGVYDLGKKNLSIGSLSIPIKTTYGLSEFDNLSYETELLLDSLQTLPAQHFDRVLVFNLGQGFIPVALSQFSKVDEIVLADRDLLALRASKRNLEINGFSTRKIFSFHQVGISQNHSLPINCIMGILEEKDGSAVHKILAKQAVSELAPNGLVLLASSSTAISRVESFVHSEKLLDVLGRRRNKGKSLIILKNK